MKLINLLTNHDEKLKKAFKNYNIQYVTIYSNILNQWFNYNTSPHKPLEVLNY